MTFDQYISDAVDGYRDCLLWVGLHWSGLEEDEPEPLDDVAGDAEWSEEALAETSADVRAFVDECRADTIDAGMDARQCGHDFCLTRNHHGTGFWDRGLGEAGRRLTDAADVYGESDAYLGDDGRLYVQ
jgi:hypothetical protein